VGFIKHLVIEAQTRDEIVKSAISLHSSYVKIYKMSNERDYSWYVIDFRSVLICSVISVPSA